MLRSETELLGCLFQMWLSLWFSRSGRFSSLHLSFVQIDRSSDVESKKSCIQDIIAIPIMNGEVLLEAIPFSNLLFLNRVIFIDCDTLTSDLAWPSVPGRLKGAANTGVWWLLVILSLPQLRSLAVGFGTVGQGT